MAFRMWTAAVATALLPAAAGQAASIDVATTGQAAMIFLPVSKAVGPFPWSDLGIHRAAAGRRLGGREDLVQPGGPVVRQAGLQRRAGRDAQLWRPRLPRYLQDPGRAPEPTTGIGIGTVRADPGPTVPW